jgi:hypothetical protein
LQECLRRLLDDAPHREVRVHPPQLAHTLGRRVCRHHGALHPQLSHHLAHVNVASNALRCDALGHAHDGIAIRQHASDQAGSHVIEDIC